MIGIWKNFVSGRKKDALVMMIVFGLSQIAFAFMFNPWWLWGPLTAFGWIFVVPSMCYLTERG